MVDTEKVNTTAVRMNVIRNVRLINTHKTDEE